MTNRYLYIGLVVIVVMGILFVALVGRRALSWLRGRLARPAREQRTHCR